MHLYLPLSLIVAAFLTCNAASASESWQSSFESETIAFRTASAGTQFFLKGSGKLEGMQATYEIEKVEGMTVYTTIVGGKQRDRWPSLLATYRSDVPIQPFEKEFEKLWPLAVGKRIAFTHEARTTGGGFSQFENTLQVIRSENLALARKEVATYVIAHTSRNRKDGTQSTKTYWYAPDVGFILKYAQVSTDSKLPALSWEVVEIRKTP